MPDSSKHIQACLRNAAFGKLAWSNDTFVSQNGTPHLSNNISCTEPHDLGNPSRILILFLYDHYDLLQDDNAPVASHLIFCTETESFTRIRPAIHRGTTARQTKHRLIPILIRQFSSSPATYTLL